MFTLIITIILAGQASVAVTTVPGFESNDQCMAAAQAWMAEGKNAQSAFGPAPKIFTSAVCASLIDQRKLTPKIGRLS